MFINLTVSGIFVIAAFTDLDKNMLSLFTYFLTFIILFPVFFGLFYHLFVSYYNYYGRN